MAKAVAQAVSGNMSFLISKISELKKKSSPEFIIQGISWKVIVMKKYSDGEASLAVFLFCRKKNKTREWTQPARFSIKLLSFISDFLAVEKHFSLIYDHTENGYGTPSLIKWDDLYDPSKGYIKDDAINLDIQVEVADTNEAIRSFMMCTNFGQSGAEDSTAKYRFTVTNIENLMAARSKKIVLQNIPYYFSVYKSQTGQLSADLDPFSLEDKASTVISMSLKLLSSKDGATKTIEKVETRGSVNWENLDFEIISWTELICPENEYIENGSINIEAEIKLKRPTEVTNEIDPTENENVQAKRPKLECAVCMEEMANKEVSSVPCGHMFCSPCIQRAIEDSSRCPSCNTRASVNQLKRSYLNWRHPTEIENKGTFRNFLWNLFSS